MQHIHIALLCGHHGGSVGGTHQLDVAVLVVEGRHLTRVAHYLLSSNLLVTLRAIKGIYFMDLHK